MNGEYYLVVADQMARCSLFFYSKQPLVLGLTQSHYSELVHRLWVHEIINVISK